MPQKSHQLMYWTPRILSILFVLFLAMFSLDVFEICSGFSECALALFMHNVPALILLALTVVAWKREWVGAAVYALGGLLYIGLLISNSFKNGFEWYYLAWSLIIASPAFVISALYWLSWKQNPASMSLSKSKKIKN